MYFLKRNLFRPHIWMAHQIHTFVRTGLTDVQQEWCDSRYICARGIKLINCVIIKPTFTGELFAPTFFGFAGVSICFSAWRVVIKIKCFRIVTAAVSRSKDSCTLLTFGQLHYPTSATNAHHKRSF